MRSYSKDRYMSSYPFNSRLKNSAVYNRSELRELTLSAQENHVSKLIIFITLEKFGTSAARYVTDALSIYDHHSQEKNGGDLDLKRRQLEYHRFLIQSLKVFRKYEPMRVVMAILTELKKNKKGIGFIQLTKVPVFGPLRDRVMKYVSIFNKYEAKNGRQDSL